MTSTYEDGQFEELQGWLDDFLGRLQAKIDEIDKEVEEEERGKLGS